jgi:polar amino acid transport system substrate-binding protein
VKRLLMKPTALALIGILLTACSTAVVPTVQPVAQVEPTNVPTLQATIVPPGVDLPKLRFAIDPTYPPFEAVDYNRAVMIGFDVELIQAIAGRVGVEVEFFPMAFNQVLTGVANCEYDGAISAIEITDDLKWQMLFSDPYLSISHVLVVKSGNITISGWDTLAGKTVGGAVGSLGETEAGKIPGALLKSYPTYDFAYQELIDGLIDAVVSDAALALSYTGVRANRLKIVENWPSSVNYGIAVCKDRADLVELINTGLASVKADGTLAELASQWLANP